MEPGVSRIEGWVLAGVVIAALVATGVQAKSLGTWVLEVVWVLIEELHTDGWHIGGRPFEGPRSLMTVLEHSKAMAEAITGRPASREEFARAVPVLPPPEGRPSS